MKYSTLMSKFSVNMLNFKRVVRIIIDFVKNDACLLKEKSIFSKDNTVNLFHFHAYYFFQCSNHPSAQSFPHHVDPCEPSNR